MLADQFYCSAKLSYHPIIPYSRSYEQARTIGIFPIRGYYRTFRLIRAQPFTLFGNPRRLTQGEPNNRRPSGFGAPGLSMLPAKRVRNDLPIDCDSHAPTAEPSSPPRPPVSSVDRRSVGGFRQSGSSSAAADRRPRSRTTGKTGTPGQSMPHTVHTTWTRPRRSSTSCSRTQYHQAQMCREPAVFMPLHRSTSLGGPMVLAGASYAQGYGLRGGTVDAGRDRSDRALTAVGPVRIRV